MVSHSIPLDPAPAARVSVIIPVYRRTRFLEDAIESVLTQSHPVWEILIVDDGSEEEGTLRELKRIAVLSDRITLDHLPVNKGAAAARNHGLEKATGDYVLFLDDDDLLHPKAVEAALTFMEADSSIDVATSLYEIFFTPESAEGCPPLPLLFNARFLNRHPLNLVDHSNPVARLFLEGDPFSSFLRFLIPIHSCLVRRSSIGSTRFPEELVQGEDTYFWLTLAGQGCRFRFIDTVYVYVRRHANNKTSSKRLYWKEIPYLYLKLLEEGLFRDRNDLFLVHLKLFYFSLRNGRGYCMKYFLMMFLCPDLLAKEVLYWGTRAFKSRYYLLRYYLHG